jgi:hypothetical protein
MRRWILTFVVLVTGMQAVAADAPSVPSTRGVYHELTCPSVEPSRMVRMPRAAAAALGSLPAMDCHPDARMRYLGISGAETAPPPVPSKPVHVDAYIRRDGTPVSAHDRAAPQRH